MECKPPIPLPESFLSHIRALLGEDFLPFAASYSETPWRGIRFNPLKLLPAQIVKFFEGGAGETFFQKSFPCGFFSLIPWCASGRAYKDDIKPGQSLAYLAGLFYIQEPSAMLPAALLDARPGERILDLCAAPGGKTTQIAGAMQNRGLLIANDASPARAQALVRNIERAGVRNAVILTEQPRRLASRFPGFFDRVLADAPCSGEGMFRRDADVLKAYTHNKPEACAAIQSDILRHAAAMVKPGGRLVYSTCTFNTIENEGVVEAFLKERGDFKLAEINHAALGVGQGVDEIRHAARIFPHRQIGEGHFAAVMERVGDSPPDVPKQNNPARGASGGESPTAFTDFCRVYLTSPLHGNPVVHGNHLFLQPEPFDVHGLRTARSGWHVGEISKGRFIPSQALAMALRKEDARFSVNLSEADAWRYVKGESLDMEIKAETDKPWLLVCHNAHPLGWARWVQGRLKNHLPVGWVRS